MESIFTEIFRLFLKAVGTVFLIVSIFMMGNTAIDLLIFQEPTNRYDIDNAEWQCKDRMMYKTDSLIERDSTNPSEAIEQVEEVLEKGSLDDSVDVVKMKKEILEILREQKILLAENEEKGKKETEECIAKETAKNLKNWKAENIKTLLYGGVAFVIGIVLLIAGRRRK